MKTLHPVHPVSSTPHQPAFHEARHRQKQLETAKSTLKAQFLGIDDVVDALVDATGAWYLFPEAQERPRTIGLWGMTGTGKSSLVKAMLNTLGLQDRTFWLDAGQNRDHAWLEQPLSRMGDRFDGEPFVLVVDEFQHARTIVNGHEEKESGGLRSFWDLLDSGRYITWSNHFRFAELLDLRDQLGEALERGVRVREGRVVRGSQVHARCLNAERAESRKKEARSWFVPDRALEWLGQSFGDRTLSRKEIRQQLSACDGPGTIDLFDEWVAACSRMHVVDGSKALVIVLGNLDELYVMGKELWPELDPDVLVHRHRKLTATGIQPALCSMFRIEQVGRLGADNILFPPLGREEAERVARQQVDRMTEGIRKRMGTTVNVSDGICARLCRSAAMPVLGARPLVAAVQRAVPALVSQALLALPELDGSSGALSIEEFGDAVIAHLPGNDANVPVSLTWPFPVVRALRAEQVRRIAVHEAGHVVAGVALTRMRPLQVCVRSGAGEAGGFVVWDDAEANPLLLSGVPGRLALLLGGHAAERWQFGETGISTGSGSDLESATRLALTLLKEEGFGTSLCFQAEHELEHSTAFRAMRGEREREARAWLDEALTLATTALKKEARLFTALVDRLCKDRSLNAAAMEELMIQFGTGALLRSDVPIAISVPSRSIVSA